MVIKNTKMTYEGFLNLVKNEVRGRDWDDISDARKRDIAYSSVLAVGANADITRLQAEDFDLAPHLILGHDELYKAELPAELFHYREDNGIIHIEFDNGVIKYPRLNNRPFSSLRMLENNEWYSDEPFMHFDAQARALYLINSTTAKLRYIKLFTQVTAANESSLEVPLGMGDVQQAVHVMSVYLKSLDIRDAAEASVHGMVGQMLSIQREQVNA